MAQPTAYERLASFSNYQAQNPADPLSGASVDAEFNAVKETLDDLRTNIALIQRDDGALANRSVGLDQLSEEIEVGWQAPEVWVTATAYVVGNTVFHGSAFYRCLIAHTAGTFATDLSAAKWEIIVDLSTIATVSATQVANTPSGSIAATTVQAAIDELASEKAAASHTHAASAISDSTAAGRSMLTAANAAAQGVLLGLGDLAFEDTIVVSDIEENLAFTGIIEPAALNGDTNNWTPTGIGTASTVRVAANVAISLTGIAAPTVDGTILFLENVGSSPITLPRESASSTAANRFLFSRNFVLRPNQGIILKYDKDGTTPRWRALESFSEYPRGHISGLQFTNNVTDAVNDFDISEGEARDATNAFTMIGTAMTKRLDADWAPGTGNGVRHSGAAITDTTYHVYLVGKLDGTTDYYAHTSAVAATALAALQAESGGSAYVFAREIFPIMRSTSIVAMTQDGDSFLLNVHARDVNNSASHTSAQTATLSVPLGLKVHANIIVIVAGTSADHGTLVTSLDQSDNAPSLGGTQGVTSSVPTASARGASPTTVRTNTSGQIRYRASDGGVDTAIITTGFTWNRGRFA